MESGEGCTQFIYLTTIFKIGNNFHQSSMQAIRCGVAQGSILGESGIILIVNYSIELGIICKYFDGTIITHNIF